MATKKAKSKEWFTILAPDYFNKKEIGKTPVDESKKLIGRKISISLIGLTNDYSKYYMKFIFRIVELDGNTAHSEFLGSEILKDYISRMIFRRIRRVDTVQNLKTKEGKTIRVKGLAIIPRRIKSSIQIKIRNRIKEIIKEEVEKGTLDDFLDNLLNDSIKSHIIREIRNTYPIRNFEIRKTEVPSQKVGSKTE